MAYRAEIEIGVKGLRELRNLRKTVDEVNQQVDLLNDISRQFNLPLQNIQAYNKTLATASDTLKKVRAGTQQETDAITDYVYALGQANAARDRQNRLIDQQIAKQKAAARTIKASQTGFTSAQMTPALPPQLRRVGTVRTSWGVALEQLNEIAVDLKATAELKELNIKSSWNKFFKQAEEIATDLQEDAAKRKRGITADAKRRRARLSEDLLLGAGFPLLFGGGPGAVLGGVGGALAGGGRGGFGLQIFGSAIGQQLDAIAQDALNTATALTSTAGALAFVREKSLFSSDAIKEQAAVLEEQGDVAGLAALLTGQLAEKIGNQGVQSLVDLGQTTNETTRLWNELTLQLQALISGPLQGFLELVNGFLKGITTEQRFAAFERSVQDDPEALQRFREIEARVRGVQTAGRAKGSPGILTTAKQEEILRQAEAEGLRPTPTTPIIPQTLQDRRDIRAPKATAGDKAKREEQRLQERLRRLEAERVKVLEVSRFQDRIAAAVAEGNEQLRIRLEGEQRIAEIEQERLRALAKVTDQREIDAINIGKATEKLAAQRNTERELAKEAQQRNENFDRLIENLQLQLEIATATTREEAEQLRIRQEMENLRDKSFSEEQLARIKEAKQNLNRAQQPLNKFITDSTRSLNDLEQVAVNVSQGIGNAIGSSLDNGITQLIEGSATVKEVFADMLKSIGQVLVQEGTKMIATYIAIGIARAFAGLAGGSDKAINSESLSQIQGYSGVGANTDVSGLAAGLRSNGGPVQGGRPYMVGERGPELFVPSANGGVMRNEDMRQLMGRSPIGNAPQMSFTFETTNIGGQEFVSREQLELAMATTRRQAANDGAKRGMSMTLDKMQNSPRTRSRIGIS